MGGIIELLGTDPTRSKKFKHATAYRRSGQRHCGFELRRNTLARTVPQTPLAGGATDTAQAASGLISTA
jgi:hypothetical protein